MTSSLFWLLADMLKQATVRSLRDFSSIFSITYSSLRAPYKSFLLPNTNKGIPARLLFWSSSCICVRASYMLPSLAKSLLWSKESTTNIITSESLQNFSHDSLKRACPPKSHNFIDILPAITIITTFLYLMMVEPNCRYCVLFKSAISNRLDKGSFSCILKPYDCYLKFLVEKFRLDPGQNFIDEPEHLFLDLYRSKTYYYKCIQVFIQINRFYLFPCHIFISKSKDKILIFMSYKSLQKTIS